MFILTTFLMNTLHHFKKRYAPLYLCVLVGCECCLYGCEVLNSHFPTMQSEITATLISLGTTFILCLFFTSSLKAKLYMTLLFQTLAALGEAIFTFLFTKLNPDFYAESDTTFMYSVMNIGSKSSLFLLCLLSSILLRKKSTTVSTEYKLLVLSTPIISIIIYVCLPIQQIFEIDTVFFYKLLICCLALLNIINYILIQKEYASTALKYTNAQMEEQICFQKEKYEQLSESYRQSRRIIHDLKKQYFCINEYVDNKTTEEVLQLPEIIAKEKEIKIVVCIDEFQQIGDFPESLTFQKKLRSVWQHQSNVTYCLYGSKKHMMEKMFQNQSYPFYRFGDIFYLKKISEADWREYICRKFASSGKSISPELAGKICEITDRYSSYVQAEPECSRRPFRRQKALPTY